MKPRPERARTWRGVAVGALWVVTLVGAATMVAGWLSANAAAETPGPLADGLLFVVLAIDAVACTTMGALIVVRQPGNRIGWLLALVGVSIVGAFNGFAIGTLRLEEAGRDDVLGGLFALMGVTNIILLAALVGAVALLFPNGHLPSRRWGYAAAPPFGLVFLAIVAIVFQPEWDRSLPRNPIGIDHPLVEALEPLLVFGPIGIVATLGIGVPALIWRFIVSTGEVRHQIKWFAAAVALVLTSQVVAIVVGNDLVSLLSTASIVLVPVSVGLGVLRYRLYAIDRIISRTLGWAVITGILGAIFLAGLLALQTVMSGVTGSDTIAVAASTLVAFALFQPVRRRVQAAVDRRFDRSRYDAATVVEQFTGRLRNQLDLQALTMEVERAAISTVRPMSVEVWLRGARRRP